MVYTSRRTVILSLRIYGGYEMGDQKLITMTEAAARLGVSRVTMARLVREGRFTVYENPFDRRQKLIDVAELEVEPRILQQRRENEEKAAA